MNVPVQIIQISQKNYRCLDKICASFSRLFSPLTMIHTRQLKRTADVWLVVLSYSEKMNAGYCDCEVIITLWLRSVRFGIVQGMR